MRRCPMTVKTSISLTDEQEAYARSLVEAGQFPSVSAVLQRGLDMLRRDGELHAAELDAMRTLIDRPRAGPFVDLDDGQAETRAVLARERKRRASRSGPPGRRQAGREAVGEN